MTTEEKAKAYEMALEAARKELSVDRKEWEVIERVLKSIFPELRESEDERIRKVIYKLMLGMREEIFTSQDEIVTKEKVLAYLEKQKEPKPKEPGYKHEDYFCERCQANAFNAGRESVQKEQKPELVQHPPITYTYPSDASRDERLKAALLALLNSDLLKVKEGGYFTKQDLIEWVERIPTDMPAWSEEDEKNLELVTDCVYEFYPDPVMKYKLKDWLKSLRPGWKPTEEQMEALNYAIAEWDGGKRLEGLYSLRNDLKKL